MDKTESNNYVMCMKCQDTHHEDEDHTCTPVLVDHVYDGIRECPGIDTPLLCLKLHDADFIDPGHRGADLAMWIHEWHRKAWNDTCEAVDWLLERGQISFSDDGELRATGY